MEGSDRWPHACNKDESASGPTYEAVPELRTAPMAFDPRDGMYGRSTFVPTDRQTALEGTGAQRPACLLSWRPLLLPLPLPGQSSCTSEYMSLLRSYIG